jgi:DNA-directed RNA polymerase subunit RPC12/RpoP
MIWKCDNCGKEFELKFNPDDDSIDPPYFCPACERLMEEVEPEEIDDDFMNYGGWGE